MLRIRSAAGWVNQYINYHKAERAGEPGEPVGGGGGGGGGGD